MRRSIRSLSIISVFVSSLVPIASTADLLGSGSLLMMGIPLPEVSSSADVRLCFAVGPPAPPPGCEIPLLDLSNLSTADAGATFVATAANSPLFAAASQLLTNGTLDTVEVEALLPNSGVGTADSEGGVFFGDPSGALGIDFTGFTINSIEFQIGNDFQVTPQPSQGTTAVGGSFFIQVFGTVPEPGTFVLLGSGIAGLVMFGRSKRG